MIINRTAEMKTEEKESAGETLKVRGAPTKYKKEFIDKVDQYLAENQDEWTEFHKVRGIKSDSYERIVKVKLPTVEKFARYIGVHKDSLYEWKGLYPDFSDALDRIVEEQKNRLMEEGLAGTYNPMIAKLILSSNHGMAEKNDLGIGGVEGGQPLEIRIKMV